MTHLFQILILNSISPWPGTKWPMLGAAFQDLLRFALLKSSTIYPPFLLVVSYWWKNLSPHKPVIYAFFGEQHYFALPNINTSLYFHNSQMNGKESAWFGAVFFAVASLSSMSSVTVCDKMADSICDTSDHKYTTQLQWLTITTNREKHFLSSWSGPENVVEKNVKFRRA